ncbi:PREDICTED: glutathione S-transferase U7-like [Tarenaya hassleriana]|uniref:glutathione transferase n=1 Tax=Tarenaya spinosa TaxID=228870 RepID=B2BXQ5_9ROSI|nr:PREDICTED: glutathione S-transferase U7-like [Tarenaya hassleriana]ABW81092.1 GST16 [Tarenaya spinosa]
MAEEVKLLGMWASLFSRRIDMALRIKGVPYEYLEQDLTNKSPLLLQMNPVHKKVPVLVHNGKSIAESLVILEYIDQTWSHNPILPQDPYERAMARFWARFIDEKIVPTGIEIAIEKDEEAREAAIEKARELMKYLEKELKGKDFFGGKTLGLVDIAAILIPFWLMRFDAIVGIGVDILAEDKFPEIHRWVKRLSETDVVKECIPPKDEHVAYLKALVDRIKSAR